MTLFLSQLLNRNIVASALYTFKLHWLSSNFHDHTFVVIMEKSVGGNAYVVCVSMNDKVLKCRLIVLL